MQPLIWARTGTSRRPRLSNSGHPISADTVRKELAKLGFSRQANRWAEKGSRDGDRNAQFEDINAKVVAAQALGQPVISADTRKRGSSAISRTLAPTTLSRAIRSA